jgi:acetolactate decarboxylase
MCWHVFIFGLTKQLNMKSQFFLLTLALFLFTVACTSDSGQGTNPSSVKIKGAMKNVMWKGELAGIISLDTIQERTGLFGLGPLEYLQGELLIMDGKSYLSKYESDSTMEVLETFDVKAPFFVYGHQTEWREVDLPEEISNISQLEKFVDEQTKNTARPFVFKLSGEVDQAIIHVQNLPSGTEVSSPDEAHQGQVDYALPSTAVDIVGFFSTKHKGVFTHHDSYMHLHLITQARDMMGHLDKVQFRAGTMKVYLPAD